MTGFVAALFETEQICAGYSVEGVPHMGHLPA